MESKTRLKPWRRIGTVPRGDFRIFKLVEEFFEAPGMDLDHGFFVIESPDWVNIVPVTDDGKVVLIRQFRAGNNSVTIEIPGGMVDAGESFSAAALRELEEETGYQAKKVTALGSVSPNPAIMRNSCHMFLASGVKPTGQIHFDSSEDVESFEASWEEIDAMIARGEINHSLVLNALFFAKQALEAL
ncbi:NUDIX hydrolase [Myxococcota bacterium]|nr:NUDIX hydrolase [Myxococcota bacterium]